MLGSKLAVFCLGDRNWLCFSVRTKIDMIFVGGPNFTLVLYTGRKLLVFSVDIGTDLVFVIFEIGLISTWDIKLGLISV